ncbi:hypothetical protein Bhyg_06555, partial [Pseudolycoriella hygida]
MGFDNSDIDDIKNTSFDSNDREAEELLKRWEEQNHTAADLFVVLARARSYGAMNTIKGLVSKRLIRHIQATELRIEIA